MFENLTRFFKKMSKSEPKELEATTRDSKETAKERLHMVLMQDRANVSADFLELMKQEIIDVIKKYIEVNEETIDVRLITKTNDDGSNGTPSLYANIPILNIRNDMKVENYKFALQSDGSIIAQKIEEPKEDSDEEIEIDLDKIKIDDDVSKKEIKEENQNFSNELSNKTSEDSNNQSDLKIEQRQKDMIKEIIPAISNIEKIEELKESGIEIGITSNNNESSQEDKKKEDLEEKKEVVQEPVVPLKKSARRGRPKKKDKKKEEKISEKEEKIDSSSEEDDDDVTFDDLLKAAEEEDRKKAEQEKKEGK